MPLKNAGSRVTINFLFRRFGKGECAEAQNVDLFACAAVTAIPDKAFLIFIELRKRVFSLYNFFR
jgi:hypothetical protein